MASAVSIAVRRTLLKKSCKPLPSPPKSDIVSSLSGSTMLTHNGQKEFDVVVPEEGGCGIAFPGGCVGVPQKLKPRSWRAQSARVTAESLLAVVTKAVSSDTPTSRYSATIWRSSGARARSARRLMLRCQAMLSAGGDWRSSALTNEMKYCVRPKGMQHQPPLSGPAVLIRHTHTHTHAHTDDASKCWNELRSDLVGGPAGLRTGPPAGPFTQTGDPT